MTHPDTPTHPVSAEDLTQALTTHFELDVAEVSPLAGEYSETWAVTAADGTRFVAKVFHDGGAVEHRMMQAELMAYLAHHEPDLPVPRVITTRDGEGAAHHGDLHVQLLTWMAGRMISEIPYRDPGLLGEIGRAAARLVLAGEGYHHSAAVRSHLWDMRRADEEIDAHLVDVSDEDHRLCARRALSWYRDEVLPRLDALPTGVVHQDLNDFNLVVSLGSDLRWHLSGILDFGDALDTVCVAEIAIAVAYAMLGEEDPVGAAAHVVAAFNSLRPLSEDELACVLPLAAARLALNATVWTSRRRHADTRYAASRMAKTWPTLARVMDADRVIAQARLRAACDLAGLALHPDLDVWYAQGDLGVSPVRGAPRHADLDDEHQPSGNEIVVRPSLWPDPAFASRRRTRALAPATLTLGAQFLSSVEMTAVASHEGTVHSVDHDGGVVVLRVPVGETFLHAHYRGLGEIDVAPGDAVSPDQPLGRSAAASAGHRVAVTWCGDDGLVAAPLRVSAEDAALWAQRTRDPLGAGALATSGDEDPLHVTSARQTRLASSQRAYYDQPMNLVSARGVWFRDHVGREYLDAINNVTHVGHGHPRVVAAASRQLRRLNTNSRFTYSGLPRYAERLVATLPSPLEVVFFTCTGSEANDLALRIARQVTGRSHVAVLEGAYHGNTTAVMGISPNRYRGAGGSGPPPTTHELPQPNQYRGAHGYDHPDAGTAFARDAERVITSMVADGHDPAAVFAESLMGTAGQIPLPPGFLSGVFAAVRGAGGLCVSDEVQVGVGRLGNTFWGFEGHGVIPDIVTMGKPLGNGYPLAAVVTTREIADAFDNGMKYFNTFAGSPVACAIGEAVLDVVRDEGLQENARLVGAHFRERLLELSTRHEVIGDVRGYGLYLGVELVSDPTAKTPARTLAYRVSERLKDEGVITYPNGDLDNVLKIKPPMVFSASDADCVVDTLVMVLEEFTPLAEER